MFGKGETLFCLLVASCQVWPNMDIRKIVGTYQGGPYYLVELPSMDDSLDGLEMNLEDYLESPYQESPIQMDRIKSLQQKQDGKKRDGKKRVVFLRMIRNDDKISPSSLLGMSKQWR